MHTIFNLFEEGKGVTDPRTKFMGVREGPGVLRGNSGKKLIFLSPDITMLFRGNNLDQMTTEQLWNKDIKMLLGGFGHHTQTILPQH